MSLVLKSNVAYIGSSDSLPVFHLLSSVKNAITMVGTRLLTASYSGAILRVRRSTDGAEKDIYSAKGGRLDTAALLSFVGSADGVVSILYDQSGNNNNFTRTNPAGMPLIVKAGILQTSEDNEPAMVFDVAKRALLLQFPPKTPQQYLGGFVEGKYTDTAFAVIDAATTKTTFRLDNVYNSGNFLYREAAGQPLVTMVLTKKPTERSRTFVAIDAVAKKAIAKDSLGVKENALLNFVPMAASSNVVLGSSTDLGDGTNAQGYITAFALVNTVADGNALSNAV